MIRNHMKSYEQAAELINCLREKSSYNFESLKEVTPETLSNYKIVIRKRRFNEILKFRYEPTGGILYTDSNKSYTAKRFIERIKFGLFELVAFYSLTN